jgi:hypothetical protein
LLIAASASAQKAAGEPLSGTWAGDWRPSPDGRNQVTVELKWDGKVEQDTMTGTWSHDNRKGDFKITKK